MNRREMITTTALGVAGFGAGTAFTAPACSAPSKEKAVRYAGIAIGYLEDVAPILSALGQQPIVDLVNKAIPALKKLKEALENNDFPTAGNMFDTVAGILGNIATAISNMPDSNRKLTVLALIALVQLTLRTIGAAIQSETNTPATAIPKAVSGAASSNAIRRAFEATRF